MISKISDNVRTRFAPSPTGFLHLGGIRTALFSWIFARHHDGKFILRIEDTDNKRSAKESIQSILDSINWLGIKPDEGPFYQSDRMNRYKTIIHEMLKSGSAYYCYSSPDELDLMRNSARLAQDKPRYDGTWRPEPGKILPEIPKNKRPVVRFKNPTHGSVVWNDLVRGTISFQNKELDDLIIARSDETPTYNFCSAIDDWDMNITHVLRGEDHINNTPRQINILESLNAKLPRYGHLPMIFDKNGKKLSKRNCAASIMSYRDQGYLPNAMINYLARLGWSYRNNEIFSQDELVKHFDVKHISKSPACWDTKKLNWINSYYIKQMSSEDLSRSFEKFMFNRKEISSEIENLTNVLFLFKNRVDTLQELAENIVFFSKKFLPDFNHLLEKYITPNKKLLLKSFFEKASEINWTRENISFLVKTVLSAHKAKMPDLAIPIRIILTGRIQTPPLEDILLLLGKKIVLLRLEAYKF